MNGDNVVDFKALKNKSEGKVTPDVLIDSMNDWKNTDSLESIVVTYVTKDGNAHVAHTDMNYLELVGLIDVSKDIIKDMMI
jgi:uncharacterized protein YjgD (DUF1641 family)